MPCFTFSLLIVSLLPVAQLGLAADTKRAAGPVTTVSAASYARVLAGYAADVLQKQKWVMMFLIR